MKHLLKPILALAAALVLPIAAPTAAEDAEASPPIVQTDPGEATFDPAVFLIPRERLSTQEAEPFFFNGRVMDESRPRWREFRRGIQEYPDVPSCLVEDEREKPIVDLLAFDWAGIASRGHSIEVCLFRVLETLDDLNLMMDWFLAQEFRVSPFSRFLSEEAAYAARNPHTPSQGFNAGWSREQYHTRRSVSGLMKFLDPAYGYSVSIAFSNDFKIVNIGFSGSTN